MEMKKIACAVLVAAASMSAVLASEGPAMAPSPTTTGGAAHSAANAALPAVGTLVGASLLSVFAYYLH